MILDIDSLMESGTIYWFRACQKFEKLRFFRIKLESN